MIFAVTGYSRPLGLRLSHCGKGAFRTAFPLLTDAAPYKRPPASPPKYSLVAFLTCGASATMAMRFGMVRSPRATSWMTHTSSISANAQMMQKHGNTYLNLSATFVPNM